MSISNSHLRFLCLPALFLYAACHVLAASKPPLKARVLKDNTNLRAKPALNVEVVGQVSSNQELVTRSMDAEWIEVIAPTNIDFWILGEYLKDGVVACKQKVNVRSGPGINFNAVGQLSNEDKVEVRGSHGEWIKIAPPEVCSLWVSRALVEIVPAVPPAPVLPATVPSMTIPSVPAAPQARPPVEPKIARPLPPPLKIEARKVETPEPAKTAAVFAVKGLDLMPDKPQGQWKQYEGVLRYKNLLVRSPYDFKLVGVNAEGREYTACYVKGNRAQLDALVFRELVVQGREYWVQRLNYPVLIPEKIILK